MDDQYEDFKKFTDYITGDGPAREKLAAAAAGDDDGGGKKGKKKGKKKK
jgi:hypothetical protein